MNNETDYYFREEKNETNSLKKIAFFVFTSHILLICFFSFYHSRVDHLKKKTFKCQIRTIQEQNLVNSVKPEMQKARRSVAINNQKKTQVSTKAKKTEREEVKKVEAKPKEIKKIEKKEATSKPAAPKRMDNVKKLEKEVVSKSNEAKPKEKIVEKIATKDLSEERSLKKKKELLALAKQNLAAVGGNGNSAKNGSISKGALSTVENLKTFEVVSEDQFLSSFPSDITYEEELALRLRNFLTLPERGDVKIKLTLAKSGEVLKLAIVSFQSERNRKYIEEKVKALIFPQFQGDFSRYPEYTFSITLK